MDQAVCCVYNILRRTVIPFQLEDAAPRILVLKLQNIIDIRPAERIDTLCIIPDNTNAAVRLA